MARKMVMPQQLFLGFTLAMLAALVAWRLGWLSGSGALAAFILGGIVCGLGGWAWAILLLSFFLSSSLLSRMKKRQKESLDEKYAKGARRDWGQVLANGGVAGGMVLLHAVFPEAAWPWLAFAGSLAAANADTWATELGVLSNSIPRNIATGRKVERGTSGAISLPGTLSAFAGALLIGLLAAGMWSWAVFHGGLSTADFFLASLGIGLSGVLGSLADSLLGATIQAIFYCPACQKETERHPLHTCGALTRHIRGWRWLNNDWVNLMCTLSGCLSVLAFGLAAALI